ncbi:MAG: SdiA-regulated domain-containing protein [Bacteroidia bacterium]|nr:SdiA-regulated domain-containing protein [Bacteroidia bacterium]
MKNYPAMPVPYSFLYVLFFPLLMSGCQEKQPAAQSNTDTYMPIPFPYNLSQADKKTKLPDELNEVSGLGYWADEQIYMVQDELARVYIFDIKKDSVVKVIPFGETGDFEGIEVLEKNLIITLSTDGILTKISQFEKEIPKLEKIQTPMTGEYEPEGLGYLPSSRRLLIACKEEPEQKSQQGTEIRNIYYYDIGEEKMGEKPFASIDLSAVGRVMAGEEDTEETREWKAEFDPRKGESFRPSGIAVHPVTGEIYIIASVGKLLVVLDSALQVKHAKHLSREIFKQPEGICFDPEGNLYISNEGRDGKANVLRFNYSGEK